MKAKATVEAPPSRGTRKKGKGERTRKGERRKDEGRRDVEKIRHKHRDLRT